MTIVLVVLGAVVGLFLILLFLPLTVNLKYYDKKLMLNVKYFGITVFNSEKQDKIKNKKKPKKQNNKTATPKQNFIRKTYEQKGLSGTISYFCEILLLLLKRLVWIVKRFKFRRLVFDLVVADGDAANTAIHYGEICAAVYPIFSLLQSIADIKTKTIKVNADFEKAKWEFSTSILVKTNALYWLIAIIYLLVQFLKLQHKECEKYERKQH